MKAVEASAKTREEAIQKALQDLGVEMYEVDKIEIVDEGSRGLFGFGARPVRVRLIVERLHEEPQRRDARPAGNREGGRDARPERGQQERGRGGRGGRDRNETPRAEGDRNRGGRDARPERPARDEKNERNDRPARGERPARAERPAAAERAPRPEATEAGQPSAAGDRPERGERGDRGDRGRRRRGGRGRGGNREEGANTSANPESAVASAEAAPRTAPAERVPARAEARAAEEVASAPITDEQGREAAALLQQMIELMGIGAKVEFLRGEEGGARLNVESEDGALLIGRKGRNLSAMQYLVNRMVSRGDTAENTERLVVDVEGYVDRRRQSLEELALEEAARAKESGRTVRLKPMSPWERRIIHLTLQDNEDVRTFSLGEALYRSVVISPKDGEQPERGAGRASRGGGRSGGRGEGRGEGRGGRSGGRGEGRSEGRGEGRGEQRGGRAESRRPAELDDINDEIVTPASGRREPSILAMKPVRPIRPGQRAAEQRAAEETAAVDVVPQTEEARTPVASGGPRGAQSRRRARGRSQHETDYDAGALGD